MSNPPITNVVGAYQAKTHLSQLLDKVELGEEFVITKHGRPVARLVPATETSTVEQRAEAIQKMIELRRHNRLDGLSIRDMIEEGRK